MDIYTQCPTYHNQLLTLRRTKMEDAPELLKCYSDEKAVPLFNSDNCNGDDFHYTSLERMERAIGFWNYSFDTRQFVRWTIILNETGEVIGTVEMFHRLADDEFNHYGVLRIDLHSKHETQEVIAALLDLAADHFYTAFDVKAILTKAVPQAAERISALIEKGFQPLHKKLGIYDDYYVCFS